MEADSIEQERVDHVDEDVTQEGAGDLHTNALAIGAGAGVVIAAFIFGSMVLLLVLLMGAVAGGLVAAIGAMAIDKARGRRATE